MGRKSKIPHNIICGVAERGAQANRRRNKCRRGRAAMKADLLGKRRDKPEGSELPTLGYLVVDRGGARFSSGSAAEAEEM